MDGSHCGCAGPEPCARRPRSSAADGRAVSRQERAAPAVAALLDPLFATLPKRPPRSKSAAAIAGLWLMSAPRSTREVALPEPIRPGMTTNRFAAGRPDKVQSDYGRSALANLARL